MTIKSNILFSILFTALLSVSPEILWGAPITVENASFESPVVPEGGNSYAVDSWILYQPTVFSKVRSDNLTDPSSLLSPSSTDGSNIGYIQYYGMFIQFLSATLTANTTYTLKVDMGKLNGYAFPWAESPPAGLYFGGKSGIYIGHAAPEEDYYKWYYGTRANARFDTIDFVDGGWTEVELEFTIGETHSGLGEDLWISIFAYGGGTSDRVVFDNVRLNATSTVPLPASAWLLTSGLIGLVGIGRRLHK